MKYALILAPGLPPLEKNPLSSKFDISYYKRPILLHNIDEAVAPEVGYHERPESQTRRVYWAVGHIGESMNVSLVVCAMTGE
jgi:hypothetical protein